MRSEFAQAIVGRSDRLRLEANPTHGAAQVLSDARRQGGAIRRTRRRPGWQATACAQLGMRRAAKNLRMLWRSSWRWRSTRKRARRRRPKRNLRWRYRFQTPKAAPAAAPDEQLTADFWVGATAGWRNGVVPDGALGPGLFVALATVGLSFAPSVRLSAERFARGNVAASSGSASFTWTALTVDGCPLRTPEFGTFYFRPCLALEAGQIKGKGTGVTFPKNPSRLWLTPALLGRGLVEIGSWLRAEGSVGFGAPLTRPGFVFDSGESVHEVPAIHRASASGPSRANPLTAGAASFSRFLVIQCGPLRSLPTVMLACQGQKRPIMPRRKLSAGAPGRAEDAAAAAASGRGQPEPLPGRSERSRQRAFVERNASFVSRVLWSQRVPRAAIDDAVQQVFLVALPKMAELMDELRFPLQRRGAHGPRDSPRRSTHSPGRRPRRHRRNADQCTRSPRARYAETCSPATRRNPGGDARRAQHRVRSVRARVRSP